MIGRERVLDELSSRYERPGARGEGHTLTRLKWLAIVAPLAFLALLQYLLHSVLWHLHDFPGVLIVFALVALGIAVFSFGVFRVITRLERRILERNQELAALLAVGRAATSSLAFPEMFEKALAAILDVTPAEAAEIWLAAPDGELTLEQRRGPPAEELGGALELRLDLRHRNETVGALVVVTRDPEALAGGRERRLLEGIGEQLAAAIENSRLHERVLDSAVVEERERIGRELHDGLAQVLAYITTQTLAVKKLLASGRLDEAREQLGKMEQAARSVYADLREAILGLRASAVAQGDLVSSLRSFLQDYGDMAGVALRLEVDDAAEALSLPVSTEVQLMRVIQEALANVRKHAEATQATVRFAAPDGELVVEVADDGRGFVLDRAVRTGWPRFGLQTMRERTEALGGEFELVSSPGRGTTVAMRIPLDKLVEAAR